MRPDSAILQPQLQNVHLGVRHPRMGIPAVLIVLLGCSPVPKALSGRLPRVPFDPACWLSLPVSTEPACLLFILRSTRACLPALLLHSYPSARVASRTPVPTEHVSVPLDP